MSKACLPDDEQDWPELSGVSVRQGTDDLAFKNARVCAPARSAMAGENQQMAATRANARVAVIHGAEAGAAR